MIPFHLGNRSISWRSITASILTSAVVAASGCGGGGGGNGGEQSGGSDSANFNCDGTCANQSLSTADVTRVLQQAKTATRQLGVAGTFVVVDRVGNVLAIYQMTGAPTTTTINGQIAAQGILEGLKVPSTIAAISKAGTGAYLSSQGNAFSTRTASQIIQENFLPGQTDQPGGPLSGVQFSQLICSDVTVLNPSFTRGIPFGSKPAAGGSIGPRPLPLGLSADPGGLPLYKNGDLVGGIGVEFDGLYTVDRDVSDFDDLPEERVALAASIGFEAPAEIVGDNIFVAGRSFRFSDLGYSDLEPLPAELDALDDTELRAETFYADAVIRGGSRFGDPSSGVAKSARAGAPAAILVDGAGNSRFPSRAGPAVGNGAQLQAAEVEALLDSGLLTARRARAGIRTPRDTPVRVSIWIVDHLGNPLGFTRSDDAPVFGIDVSLQKARASALLSSADAGAVLSQAAQQSGAFFSKNYASEYTRFTQGLALDGSVAFSDRSIGNLARPFFLDGINGTPNGPFSLPFPGSAAGRTWSPFNTGLQLDIVVAGLAQPLGIPVNPPKSVPDNCGTAPAFGRRVRNGIQIFAGAVPLYRGNVLIGAIGVSGDGIDQDDMVAFLGASRKGLDFAGHQGVGDSVLGFNAPVAIRSDKVPVPGEDRGLRYVNCPEAPFSASNEQNVCEGF
jgi:uncharacterized protein GlcG (DUF336 family)